MQAIILSNYTEQPLNCLALPLSCLVGICIFPGWTPTPPDKHLHSGQWQHSAHHYLQGQTQTWNSLLFLPLMLIDYNFQCTQSVTILITMTLNPISFFQWLELLSFIWLFPSFYQCDLLKPKLDHQVPLLTIPQSSSLTSTCLPKPTLF